MFASRLSGVCEGKRGRREEPGKGPSCKERPRERDRLAPWAGGGEELVRQNVEAKSRGGSFTAGHSHTAACVSNVILA